MSDQRTVVTKIKTYAGAALLSAEAGSTGPMGGDSGHGGRQFVRIIAGAGFELRPAIIHRSEGGGVVVEMTVAGDWEAETMIQALRWIADTLEAGPIDPAEYRERRVD